jgi:N-acetylglutamate synthase-like GNAT family acetyltransferase
MNLIIRKANRSDVPEIVRLLADDALGASRENHNETIMPSYYSAFDIINADKNNCLMVTELSGNVVGTMQLTFTTYMTYQGGKRAQIEGVRIDRDVRGQGIGKAMIEWAVAKAKKEGCHVIQLTTDKRRLEALEFYIKLGFIASHEGLKLHF